MIAHYDTVPWTPGANDNAANVSILLEVARVLSDASMPNDVIFLFTDGEEPNPRPGMNNFVDHHPWSEDIGFVINLETNGSAGPSLLVEINGSEPAVIDAFQRAEVKPVAYSFLTEIMRLLGDLGTDFDRIKAEGVPGVQLVYTHGSPVYHTEHDSFENLGVNSLGHQGAATLALVRAIGNTPPRRIRGPGQDDLLHGSRRPHR